MRAKQNWLPITVCLPAFLLLVSCSPSDRHSSVNNVNPAAMAPEVAAPAPPPAPQAPPLPSPAEQRVTALIRQVEAAYASGASDYNKGKLPEAKAEFDRAVDLMLSSSIDIRTNPRLQEEFDHIVDQINALEAEALKKGNGFVPAEEPTPADVAADVTFNNVDPNIVAKAKADLATTKSDLPLVVNDYVAGFINFFANTQRGHNTLLHSFQRSGHYRAMIQRVMAEEGVPQDLIYLAVAESGFNPRAIGPRTRSGGRAGGMWQFMPSGNYGLVRNSYVDERFDPEKSTRAYARYMKFIYDQLGDWYLSMAAYDWGSGNVQRAVQKTGYADFWELYKRNELPVETRNYVPEILAAIIIANNPTQYGFDDITLDPPVLTDTITVNSSVSLKLVSDIVGAPVDEIEALNPSLLRMVTPPDDPYDLHLPAGTGALFTQRVALIPEGKRNAWRYHAVVAGDTLASVAHEYQVQPEALAEANQLHPGDSLDSVQALAVPAAPSAAPTSLARLYTARRGDTLVTIADRFGVSLEQLRTWNHLTGVKVAAGSRLHIAEPAATGRSARSHRHKALAASNEDDTKHTAAPEPSRSRKGSSAIKQPATKGSSSAKRSATARGSAATKGSKAAKGSAAASSGSTHKSKSRRSSHKQK
jgi:membrane-bound lytic murein transglycosylase D